MKGALGKKPGMGITQPLDPKQVWDLLKSSVSSPGHWGHWGVNQNCCPSSRSEMPVGPAALASGRPCALLGFRVQLMLPSWAQGPVGSVPLRMASLLSHA